MQLQGLQRASTGTLVPHQSCEFGIITAILMVIKAQGSDIAKVTWSEGGKVGLNSGLTSRPAFCPCAAGLPTFLLSSPQKEVREGWEATEENA